MSRHQAPASSYPNNALDVVTKSDLLPSAKDMDSSIHEIQMRYKLSPVTMKTLCSVSSAPDRREILYKSCLASEFRSFPLKQTERNFFREINDHTAILYTVKDTIGQPWHKVFLLVQIDLLRNGWPNKVSASARKELYQERGRIYSLLDRILRCLTDILGCRLDASGINTSLDVLRSIKSGVWEGAGQELLLVDGIGAVKMEKLRRSGIKSIHQLAGLDFCQVERLMSRNPPFGHNLLQQLAGFPRLCCQFEIVRDYTPIAKPPHGDDRMEGMKPDLCMCRIVLKYGNSQLPLWNKNNPWVTLVVDGENGRLLWFWRGSVTELTGEKELLIGIEVKEGEKIGLKLACEEIVGTMAQSTHQMP